MMPTNRSGPAACWLAASVSATKERTTQAGLTRFVGARVTQKVVPNWENRRGELKASCYYATL
jgi:hypothetical protein